MKYLYSGVLLVLLGAGSSCTKTTLFEKLPSSYTGIGFNNLIAENDSINPLDMVNIYNGGGVGVGDFNNDGLQDLYFTGNQVSNKLYLNKGDLKFEDVTDRSGTGGAGRWSRGVSVVDINNDGWPDIYVSATLSNDPARRQNLLYINQGRNPDGVPRFRELAAEYGLDDRSHSTMANFFDYDNDGDLDMYLVVNEIRRNENPNKYRPIVTDGSAHSTGKLFKNDWNPVLKHGVFSDVSKAAGITVEGYGHSAVIHDINGDGWQDIYVANDFVSNNILYINNQDGTFSDQARRYFKHTAANAMGMDITDVNNDGLSDVIELDMNPQDNFRKKMMMMANSYQTYQNFDYYGYQYQYVRNTLQVNQGATIGQNDTVGPPIFSEAGFFSGIAETDWSWTPVVADFDNDGFRDLVVTNGYPRDVTDHDFITFRDQAYLVASKQQLLEQIPVIKISNYAFRNRGQLSFENVTKSWGLEEPTFSNGAVYADLDNDGDLDMVINNINDPALVYRNTVRDKKKEQNHYLQISFKGSDQNRNGLGAWVRIYMGNEQQAYENTPYRGYLSSVPGIAHFGLGERDLVDSAVITWPGGKRQVLRDIKADQLLEVRSADASAPSRAGAPVQASGTWFKEVTRQLAVTYIHEARDIVDFNTQKLLPHKLSEYNPALAVGDINGDGLEDLVSGGSSDFPAQAFLQQKDGKFRQRALVEHPGPADQGTYQDLGVLLFDADMDGDLDVYLAHGGYEIAPGSDAYQDRLYLNNGNGDFARSITALPANLTSKSVVRAADYDRDGDLDLFLGGRVEPWHYPKPVSSYVLRNDSRNGQVKFTDVTAMVAKDLIDVGLVCDAVFTDYDNDGWQDLILAGEWMPVTFLKNNKGIFEDQTAASGTGGKTGFWSSVAPGDFDNDGDTDYIVGNQGSNSYYRARESEPVSITARDFDNNGSFDAIPSVYLPDTDGKMKEFPAHTRDDMVKQIISMRTRFQNYKSYAAATMDQLLTPEQRKGALRLSANYLQSALLRNEGNGKFVLMPLPPEAQVSVLNGMVVDDFNGDGNLDVAVNGNDYGTEVTVGRYDALNGLLLKGDGKGGFQPMKIAESGIFIPGNGKAFVKLRSASGGSLLAASQNRGPLKIFRDKNSSGAVPVLPADVSAVISLSDGRKQKVDLPYGASFLSQSTRAIALHSGIRAVEITDARGKTRVAFKKN